MIITLDSVCYFYDIHRLYKIINGIFITAQLADCYHHPHRHPNRALLESKSNLTQRKMIEKRM